MRKFIIGTADTADVENAQRMSHVQAREMARGQAGKGYIWMLIGKHWHLVANYDNGTVWNGLAQCVPCPQNPSDDWEYLAKG